MRGERERGRERWDQKRERSIERERAKSENSEIGEVKRDEREEKKGRNEIIKIIEGET